MSRVPRTTARRVERLARHAHAFHRFAHHPLCGAYAGEVLRFGRVRVCKGCAAAASGGVLGALAGGLVAAALGAGLVAGAPSSIPASGGIPVWVPVAGVALAVSLLVVAARRRTGKFASRFAPAFLLAAAIASGAPQGDAAGLAVACLAIAVAALALARHRRRGPWRAPCEACDEGLLGNVVCSGFQPQLRREQAVMRLSARWIAEATHSRPKGEG